MSHTSPMPSFSCFSTLPSELRHNIWFYALPGPRIVYVQRCLTSGGDEEEVKEIVYRTIGPFAPEPTHFISPSSSDSIISLSKTCQESRSIAITNYTLLFPSSSTWFSVSIDFLYLDFGQSPHIVRYKPESFLNSLLRPDVPRRREHGRPNFDERYIKMIKNLALSTTCFYQFIFDSDEFVKDLVTVFSGVETIVLADPLHNLCSEVKEEFVWMKSQQQNTLSLKGEHEKAVEQNSGENANMQCLRELLLWRGTGHYIREDGAKIDEFEKKLETTAALFRPMPPKITRNGITTAKIKRQLLNICGSEDGFQQLNGLDIDFLRRGHLHEYSGSLNRSQLISFLEMALERKTTSCGRKSGLGCFIEEGSLSLQEDVPEILDWLDELGAGFEGIILREAEEGGWEEEYFWNCDV